MSRNTVIATALVIVTTVSGCKALAESYRADREARQAKIAAQVASCEGLEILNPATRESANALGERRFTIPVRNNTSVGKLVKLRYQLKGIIAYHYTEEYHIAANDIVTVEVMKTRSTDPNPFSEVIEFGGCK